MKKKMRIIIGLIVLILAVLAGIGLWQINLSYNQLTEKEYTITSDKIQDTVSLVILSDLHDHEFGKQNSELIKKVKFINPDAILMVGDMINDVSEDGHVAVHLIKELAKEYTIYYSWGNHELVFMENHQSQQLEQQLTEAGAIILDEKYKDIYINGNTIRMGGLYDYAFALDGNNTTKKENMDADLYKFLNDFQNTKNFKLMLAHRPESFICGEAIKTWNIDLVISGHVHGGQVILPFFGGLWAPEQGWFPDYIAGYHKFETLNMIITTGLGSHKEALPRFNNPPEIMKIELQSRN